MGLGAIPVQTASAFGYFSVTSQRSTSKLQIMQCGWLRGQEIMSNAVSIHCNNAG